MENKKKIDDKVIKLLGLKVIRRLLCKTDKGELELVIRKGENAYFLTLDAVPLEKEINEELMGILFGRETKEETPAEVIKKISKKKGRPYGAKSGITKEEKVGK